MRPGFINSFQPSRDPVAQPLPLPSDYWHVSNANYTASAYTPQQSITGTGGAGWGLNTTDTLYAVPFFVGRRGRTVTSLGGRWTTAPTAGAILKIGIFARVRIESSSPRLVRCLDLRCPADSDARDIPRRSGHAQ